MIYIVECLSLCLLYLCSSVSGVRQEYATGASNCGRLFRSLRMMILVLFVFQLVFDMIFSCTLFQNFSAKQRWGTLAKTQPLLPAITTSECHVAKHISFLGYFWGRNRLPCYFFSFAAVPARISNGHYEYLWIHTLDTWRTLQPILRTWAFSLSNSTSTAFPPKDEGTSQRFIPTKSNKIYNAFFDLETYYNHQNALTLLVMCRLLSKFQIPKIDWLGFQVLDSCCSNRLRHHCSGDWNVSGQRLL